MSNLSRDFSASEKRTHLCRWFINHDDSSSISVIIRLMDIGSVLYECTDIRLVLSDDMMHERSSPIDSNLKSMMRLDSMPPVPYEESRAPSFLLPARGLDSVLASITAITYYRCGVAPQARINCGIIGISKQECISKGCCYDSSKPNSIWCFNALPIESTICQAQDPKARVNCGYRGIRATECMNKSCCFDSTIPEVIWCFQPTLQAVTTDCAVADPKSRVNCGPPSITPQQCKSNGCCYDSSIPDVKWCFKPKITTELVQCGLQPKARINCGYPGISQQQCTSKGCCFDSSIPQVIWCFYPEIKKVSST
uniref:Gastrointestinal growth factor xP4 n=1 Tax=Geotrypetes seraphini TaxID=260995 RepID=A0A6P8RBN0_GEOSA|nr:putative gastrointestinal growth factor xP4 [Geotrypetes seraphini]